jgi:2-polyprenyl-3-methyl-5-hydroxy-6-metoxy-1,4-benzoquinol methylase
MNENLAAHWEKIYGTKQPHEVSWTEQVPQHSLALIEAMQLPKTAQIVDAGGGDSRLVDYLLQQDYSNITVVDISANAIERAKKRLGDKARQVHWVVSNVLDFVPAQPVDCWHDRATFHFLLQPEQVKQYISKLQQYVRGYVIIATFSTIGPDKCSGLPVQQYSEGSLCRLMQYDFEKLGCEPVTHITPSGVSQAFVYCGFKKS